MLEEALSPPSDVASIHWRAKYDKRRQSDFETLAELLWRSVAGTALAGFVFPTVLTLAAICAGRLSIGEAIALLMASVVLMGVPSGFIAFFVSIPVALFAGLIGRLMGVTDRDVWFASLVGGWSAFLACHLGGRDAGGFSAVVALAVATGQVGAGAWAYRGLMRSGAVHPDEVRFGLRQLFGVTTAVAVLAVVIRVLYRRGAFMADTAMMAVGIQAALIGLGLLASVYARRRGATQRSRVKLTDFPAGRASRETALAPTEPGRGL